MSLETKHPSYTAFEPDRKLMRDSYDGERVIKDATTEYLPYTASQLIDGTTNSEDKGSLAYASYIGRALFPDAVNEAVENAIGMMWAEPAIIELPTALEPMRENATLQGESLQDILRQINVEQMVTGRLGLLGDLPAVVDQAAPVPYLAIYKAEVVTNWDINSTVDNDSILNMVILNETGEEMQHDFSYKEVKKYRVLQLVPRSEDPKENEGFASGQNAIYKFGIFKNTVTFDPSVMEIPTLRGASAEAIPFSFINSKDLLSTPDKPPLIGLGRLSITIYRGEADYRQNLFMQGQDTLVTIGDIQTDGGASPEPAEGTRVGAGAMINMELGGDAKYVGVSSTGLSEQRESLQNDRKRASTKSIQISGDDTNEDESGKALRIRISAETANLTQIALAGAGGLEHVLKSLAVWAGANPDEVVVTPNLEFVTNDLEGKDLVDLMTAKNLGAPLSNESIHKLQKERGLTSMEFEEEMVMAQDEGLGTPGGAGVEDE